MKIQCDVCDKDEATVFCVADEAALCASCDHRVHHANKLAGKHHRFSLLHPKEAPLCDICKERRAFLFCQQDRAIMCKDCDIPIHKANEHTRKHTRFLLTGVELSATSAIYSAAPASTESASSSLTNNKVSDAVKPRDSKSMPVSITPPARTPSSAKGTTVESAPVTAQESCERGHIQLLNGGNFSESISASSISEYLTEMLPGWHVEDFLDSPSPSPCGYSKSVENNLLPFWDADIQSNNANVGAFPTEKMGFWVPQPQNVSYESVGMMGFDSPDGVTEPPKGFTTYIGKSSSRKRNEDNCFAVPQIRAPSIASKRSRIL